MYGGHMLQGDELADQVLTPPVRVGVCGRRGVGRSTLIEALTPRLAAAGISVELMAGQAANDPAVDEPDATAGPVPECEVVLLVLADRVFDADRRVLAARGDRPLLVVLNKADALPAGLPAELSGMSVLPTVATLGHASAAPAPLTAQDRELLGALAAADELPVDAEAFAAAGTEQERARRRTLLERWDLYGIRCAVSALRSAPLASESAADAAVFARMSQWSGVDAVTARLAVLADQARSRRVDRTLRELETRAAGCDIERDEIEHLLGDRAAALRVATVLGRRHEPRTSGAAIEMAGRWRERASAAVDVSARRAAMDQHRRYTVLALRLAAAEASGA